MSSLISGYKFRILGNLAAALVMAVNYNQTGSVFYLPFLVANYLCACWAYFEWWRER